MKTRARLAALLLTATAGFAAPLSLGLATPALADNCEPTEPVVRVLFPNYEENVLDERDNPTCYVLQGYVYPRLCNDSSTLLNSCLRTLNPNPFVPLSIQPYNPSAGRMVCSVNSFVLGTLGVSGSCSSSDIHLPEAEEVAGTGLVVTPDAP
jgi:hypothetical protein